MDAIDLTLRNIKGSALTQDLSWEVLDKLSLLFRSSWHIKHDADTPTGWHVRTKELKPDTAWRIFNGEEIDTSARISSAVTQGAGWHILHHLEADVAWFFLGSPVLVFWAMPNGMFFASGGSRFAFEAEGSGFTFTANREPFVFKAKKIRNS